MVTNLICHDVSTHSHMMILMHNRWGQRLIPLCDFPFKNSHLRAKNGFGRHDVSLGHQAVRQQFVRDDLDIFSQAWSSYFYV